MWNPNLAGLSKKFRVITLDMPGFGASPVQSDTHTMEMMAREILSTLDQLEVKEKAIFAGESMGGYVLFPLYRLAPERVRGLVFAATKAGADTDVARQKRFETIGKIEKNGVTVLAEAMIPALFGPSTLAAKKACVDDAREWILKASPDGVCAALRGMAARPDSTPMLSSMKIPVLVLAGAADALIPLSEMEKLASVFPEATLKSLEKTGHLISVENPEGFNHSVMEYYGE